MKTNPPKSTSNKIVVTSGTVAALLAGAHHASGQIVVGGPSFTADNVDYYWDVDGNGSADLRVNDYFSSSTSTSSSTIYQSLRAITGQGQWLENGDGKLVALGTNSIVSAGQIFGIGGILSSYGSPNNYQAIGFASGASTYVGFSFKIDGSTHYGWAQITPTWENGPGNQIEVHQWAYNSVAGEAILVGQTTAVPEPATTAAGLGLLALGAAGLRRMRRRKATAA